MRILVTNDDGIDSVGLQVLVKTISDEYETYVVAPNKRYSGFGGAVTFYKSISVINFPLNLGEKKSYKVFGTPADCIIIALDELIGPVDLVISGINDEPNVGDDIRFSATLGACREAAFSDIPAIALSLDYGLNKNNYQMVSDFLFSFLKQWGKLKIPPEVYLNINFPNVLKSEVKGVLFVPTGRCRYKDRIKPANNYNKGRQVYQLFGTKIEDSERGTDSWAVRNNYIAITPLHRDQTDKEVLASLNSIELLFGF